MLRLMFLGLMLLLAACAPGVKGSSSLNAISIDYDDATVTSGATWYVSRTWSPRAFAVNLPDLRNLFETYENQTMRTNLSGFSIFQVGLPENWDFQLYGATGLQKVTNVKETNSRVSVEWSESLVTTFIMYIPANTASGTYSGLVTIMKEDEVQILPVEIEVGGPETTGQES